MATGEPGVEAAPGGGTETLHETTLLDAICNVAETAASLGGNGPKVAEGGYAWVAGGANKQNLVDGICRHVGFLVRLFGTEQSDDGVTRPLGLDIVASAERQVVAGVLFGVDGGESLGARTSDRLRIVRLQGSEHVSLFVRLNNGE